MSYVPATVAGDIVTVILEMDLFVTTGIPPVIGVSGVKTATQLLEIKGGDKGIMTTPADNTILSSKVRLRLDIPTPNKLPQITPKTSAVEVKSVKIVPVTPLERPIADELSLKLRFPVMIDE